MKKVIEVASTRISEYDLFSYAPNAIKPEWRNSVSLQDLTADNTYYTNTTITEAIKAITEHWNDNISATLKEEIMMANMNATYGMTINGSNVNAIYVNPCEIKGFEIVVPDKVIKVLFADGEVMKIVCHEDDTFDLRRGLFVAIAKKKYKEKYTWEGIEMMATKMAYTKEYVKIVDSAIKQYNTAQKLIAEQKAKEEEKERIAKNKKRKHDAYLKRRDERRQKEIDEKNRQQFEYDVAVQVEAARRIREMSPEYQVEKFCEDFCNEWDGK